MEARYLKAGNVFFVPADPGKDADTLWTAVSVRLVDGYYPSEPTTVVVNARTERTRYGVRPVITGFTLSPGATVRLADDAFDEDAKLVLSWSLTGDADLAAATDAAHRVLAQDTPENRVAYGTWLFEELAPGVVAYEASL